MPSTKKPRRGRPRLPDSLRRDATPLYVKLNREERKRLEARADALGVTLTEWVRNRMLKLCD